MEMNIREEISVDLSSIPPLLFRSMSRKLIRITH